MSHSVLFYEKLKSIYDNQDKKKSWSQEDYDKALNEINDAKLNPGKTKTQNQYYLCRKYDLIEVGNVKHIILKPKTKTENIIYVVPYENYFEKIEESHKATGHGGRDKVEQNLKNKYNIPRIAIQIFINLCTTCNKKKSKPCKGVVIKPILSADFNSRGQIDLIDFQSTPDGNFKWVMNYQDHATKYLYLRPLTSKRATEVAHELLKIFLEQGAPQILQSDNGREFTAKIIEELAELWPECKIVHGRPRHPQSQGSVERSNQDVENMLRAWVVDNKSTKWSIGVYFVQWQKNISHHRILGRSPYRALFGTEPKVGLSSTNLPAEIIQKLSSEEDFENILRDNSEHNFDNIPSKKKKYCDINNICSVCEKSGSELQCTICKRNIHSDNCSYSMNNINDTENICLLCNNEKQIKVNRIESYKRQTIAAKKMAENSEKLFKELKVGDQIVLSVPKVDRGPLDSQNINGLVIDIRNGVYQIGTEVGIIKNWCSREELQLVLNNGLEDNKIQKDKFVSIREAVANLSIFNGQGFVKCQCQSGKRQCQTNRCLCFKKNLKCSSKCHQITTCDNK